MLLLELSVDVLIELVLELDLYTIIALKSVRDFRQQILERSQHSIQTEYPCLTFEQTCRYLKSIINESAAIQYNIELAILGYEPRPSSRNAHLTAAQRRKILHLHRKSLNLLDWTESTKFNIKEPNRIELSGGIYAATRESHSRPISFFELPSTVNNTFVNQWEHEDLGLDVLDFCIDRELDLLLLIEKPPAQ